ncbi:MAG: hypothetical protein HGA96_09515 [Desulfobulbaceae bacterium]|nr:hypothetical protein [Desulfobulbaceae bacterium]
MANYSLEKFLQVNSDRQLKQYLAGFGQRLREDEPRAEALKKKLPRIYRWLIYPWLSRSQKKSHFGQIVPLEDRQKILTQPDNVFRLPCICRKVTTGREERVCYGVAWRRAISSKICPISPALTAFPRRRPQPQSSSWITMT